MNELMIIVCLALAFLLARSRRVFASEDDLFDRSEGEQYAHKWGYTDTWFEFDDDRTVRVTGSRYPLCGYRMPYFLPFVEEVIGMPIRPEDMGQEVEHRDLPEPVANVEFLDAMRSALSADQISQDDQDRLVHSHGQLSVDEIYQVLYNRPPKRLVDVVLYPQEEADVQKIIQCANDHGVVLVPYGGGTNVSGALAIPTSEMRLVASVDMRRMKRIVWLDEENFQACVEAGISGKQLENELDARGFTAGHDPDSLEFSTLGGWIATNASGMKKNRYGNIEDIVLEATLVTPTGEVETKHATPRNSVGVQPRSFLFGSEGNFGIITKAIIKIHCKPEARQFGSLVFPQFENGVDFLKALRQTGQIPASIRLVNNNEFRFGQALKPAAEGFKKLEQAIQRFFLFKVKGFDLKKIVACTIVMEGTADEVKQQARTIFSTAKKYGGISGGSSNGKRGYMLTFGIAYIRDFFNQFHVLGETFETSVPWTNIHKVIKGVETTLTALCEKYGVPGKPYLAYRVTQTYHTGVCIYFTMGFWGQGFDNAVDVFHKIEHELRQGILDNGGSLSHHHGVGKLRRAFLPQIQSENSFEVLRQMKKAMDPNNIFAVGNGPFGND
ncbi:MAG: FAD-binding oxidoreductase [Candidatus Latescibacteria bacterium]|nr:FAD-binding oxidoreductase [Candidatus Latescibacterota bacterium]